jgi:hypothetical protein
MRAAIRRRMNLRALLPALALVSACGTATRYMQTAPSPRPLTARSEASVTIFTDTAPTVPYVEVGLIQGRQSTQWSHADTFDIYNEMREDAARVGCDAIIVTGSASRQIRDINGRRQVLEGYVASCVVYLPPPATATR